MAAKEVLQGTKEYGGLGNSHFQRRFSGHGIALQ